MTNRIDSHDVCFVFCLLSFDSFAIILNGYNQSILIHAYFGQYLLLAGSLKTIPSWTNKIQPSHFLVCVYTLQFWFTRYELLAITVMLSHCSSYLFHFHKAALLLQWPLENELYALVVNKYNMCKRGQCSVEK